MATIKSKNSGGQSQSQSRAEQQEFMKQATSGLTFTPGLILPAGALRAAMPLPIAETNPETDMQPAEAIPPRGANGEPSERDMGYINKLSRSGNIDPAKLYAFDCAPSTQRIDSLFTRMDISSLQNYVQDAMRGVPLMNSHKTGAGWRSDVQLPLGRSFWGGIDADPGLTGGRRFVSSAYMLRNNSANGGVNTDDIIGAIDAGTVSDISIGFYFKPGTPERNFEDRTWMRCNICGQDWLMADPWSEDPDVCRHWPGEVYAWNGGQEKTLCYMDVLNAGLAEYSTVYSGATDGAVILKAERAASSGFLNRSQIRQLEDTYGVRLVSRTTTAVGVLKPELASQPTAAQAPTSELSSNNPNPTNPTSQTQTQVESSRSKSAMSMPKKQEKSLDDARQEGARTALATLVQTYVATHRAMSDDEKSMCQKAMEHIAAGEMDKANECLTSLMQAGVEMTDSSEEEGQMMDDPQTEDANRDDDPVNNPITYSENGTVEDEGAAGGGGSEMDEDDNRSNPSTVALFELTVSERQQFHEAKQRLKALEKENARLAPLAEIGERYRSGLIDETVRQAVRANIANMSESRVRRMCESLQIEDIEALCQDYRTRAASRLGQVDQEGNPLYAGGRQTQAQDPNASLFDQPNRNRAAVGAKPKVEVAAYK